MLSMISARGDMVIARALLVHDVPENSPGAILTRNGFRVIFSPSETASSYLRGRPSDASVDETSGRCANNASNTDYDWTVD